MSLVLQSSGGGSVTIAEPTTASNFTQTLPAASGEVVVTGANSALVSGTAVASTSGTSIDFTSIPSWVKRITVVLNAVSTNGTSSIRLRLGYGSTPTYITTGYNSSGGQINGTSASAPNGADGFITATGIVAAASYWGQFTLIQFSPNNWNYTSIVSSTSTIAGYAAGNLNLTSNVLTAVRITTINGTDTFDNGTINILYE